MHDINTAMIIAMIVADPETSRDRDIIDRSSVSWLVIVKMASLIKSTINSLLISNNQIMILKII